MGAVAVCDVLINNWDRLLLPPIFSKEGNPTNLIFTKGGNGDGDGDGKFIAVALIDQAITPILHQENCEKYLQKVRDFFSGALRHEKTSEEGGENSDYQIAYFKKATEGLSLWLSSLGDIHLQAEETHIIQMGAVQALKLLANVQIEAFFENVVSETVAALQGDDANDTDEKGGEGEREEGKEEKKFYCKMCNKEYLTQQKFDKHLKSSCTRLKQKKPNKQIEVTDKKVYSLCTLTSRIHSRLSKRRF